MEAASNSADMLLHEENAPLALSDTSPLIAESGPNAASQVKDMPAYVVVPDGDEEASSETIELGKELVGEDVQAYVSSDGGEERTLELQGHDEPDVEGDFVDAEGLPISGNVLESTGSLPIRAPVSDDVEEDEDEDEEADGDEDEGSFVSDESYDSAVERIAVVSAADAASPVGSVIGSPTQVEDTPQQGALRQLNKLNSGVSSLDPSLLHNSGEDEFKSRVAKIAETKNLSPDDSIVRNILDSLLPIFRGSFKLGGLAGDDEDANGSGEYSRMMPVAKPTVEDDEDKEARDEEEVDQAQHDTQNQVATNGASGFHQGEGSKVLPESAQGLRVRGADYVSDNPEDSTVISPSLLELSEEAPVASLEAPILDSAKESVGKEEVENQTIGVAEHDKKVTTEGDGNLLNGGPVQERQLYVNDDDFKPVGGPEVVTESTGLERSINEVEVAGLKSEQGTSEGGDAVPETSCVSNPMEALHNVETDGGHLVNRQQREGVEVENLDAGGKSESNFEEGTNYAPGTGSETNLEGLLLHDEAGLESQEAGNSELVATESLDAVNLEQEPGSSLSSDLVLEEQVPMKSETVEEPISVKEHAETEQAAVAMKEKEKEALESDASLKLRSLPALQSPLDAVVQKEMEVGGDPEEAAEDEDDDDGEEQSTADISPPPPAFVNSKASAAPATDTPSLGGAGPSLPLRPAGLGRSIPPLEPASRVVQRSSGTAVSSRSNESTRQNIDVSEGNDEAQEKLQMIRVKFLRLAHRLGQSAHNVVVAQVLYRLGLAEQLRGGRSTSRAGAFSFERASILAEEQEAAGQDELDFGCTIMVLGKSGVGKSATINTIFDVTKSETDAYSPGTKTVREITGTIHGIKLRVIDTPGLLPSFADQRHNEKIMSSVKRLIRKSPPDIVLYFDRLDMQSRDYGDLPLLRTITDTFGAAIWFNAIVVLTHASSAPPDGANGVPLSYEMFVAQRSHVVQQTIRQAAGDMRLMNPVSLVENHAACRTNRAGQRVLPNGQVWKPQLLLLCFASKILAEANALLKLQDSSPGKPFGVRSRVPPLPFLLSSLLQSRAQLKFPDEQMVDGDDEFDDDSEEEGGSDGEEEYDDLPPFRHLTKEELGLLDAEQRKVYFEELDYREKLFMKQQWKDGRLRRREMKKKMAAASKEESQFPDESMEEDNAGSAAVPVPMPDMALPPSFDGDNPSHRYRYLDTASQWLVRPVLETHGWDHDSGYDGLNIEKTFVILNTIPASVSGQVTKDKKEANLQMECAASFKNGEGKVTLAGLDVQTIGKDLAYTLRSETRFSNFRRNKTTCGLALTFLGDTMAAGMKLEDRLMVGRRLKLVLNGGAITGRGDVAYGGSLEATLRDKDYPIVQTLSTLGLSIMDWHGDLAIGGNFQSQFMLGKNMIIARANLNNRGAGQISIRASSSEQVQMALIGLIPLLRAFIGNRIFSSTQSM